MAELYRTYLDGQLQSICYFHPLQNTQVSVVGKKMTQKIKGEQHRQPLTFPLTFGASVAFRETYEPAELSLSSLPPSCWGPSVSAEISQL